MQLDGEFRSPGLGWPPSVDYHAKAVGTASMPHLSMVEEALGRATRAVLFVDVVDSVRLMAADEVGTIGRWLQFLTIVESEILPDCSGHLVKSLGDGLLLAFPDVGPASTAAFRLLEESAKLNRTISKDQQIHIRMAVEFGEVVVSDHDIFGNSVNRAARLMTALARPNEVVITAKARDRLTPHLDADIEDLGDCFLKGIEVPVRAFRILPPQGLKPNTIARRRTRIQPAIAVIPPAARISPPEHDVLGEVIADEIIKILSRSQLLDVISRLSTSAFRSRALSVSEIGDYLDASYLLSGAYRVQNSRVILDIELSDVRSERILWTERFQGRVEDLLTNDADFFDDVVSHVHDMIASHELARSRTHRLATLESYSLLLTAITLMHRRSELGFHAAREMLELVIGREAHQPDPKAWLANWHVLRIQQGLSTDIARDTAEALNCTAAALDQDPNNPLALTIDGLVHTHMTDRHDLAELRYKQATMHNPSSALSWLLKGTHHAFTGNGAVAVRDTQRALSLSPLDPNGYYFHSLCASAYLADGNNDMALHHARISHKANKNHTSTLRAKAMAEWRLGKVHEARATRDELLLLEPGLTVSGWKKRSPAATYDFGRGMARTLLEIGVPA